MLEQARASVATKDLIPIDDTTPSNTTGKMEPIDEFQTPNGKHRVLLAAAGSTTNMEGIVETSNPFPVLMSLGSTRLRNESPWKSPSSSEQKRSKINARINEVLVQQNQEVENGPALVSPLGKVDNRITMLGRLANGAVQAAASLMGLGTDEEIQENSVTGEEN
jgi:hypothetical protein